MRALLLLVCLLLPVAVVAQNPPVRTNPTPPVRTNPQEPIRTNPAPQRVTLASPALDDLEAQDRLGNFEIQDLMSRFNQSETLNHDARRIHRSVLQRDGLQRVGRVENGPTLFASVFQGRVASWLMIDERGQVMGPQTLRTPGGAQGETICWKCGAGSDGNIHCWQIDCPVIVAPTNGNDD